LKPERLVYIALRDVDEHEKTNIRELGIKVKTGYQPACVHYPPATNAPMVAMQSQVAQNVACLSGECKLVRRF
jgi:arginase family enzyme